MTKNPPLTPEKLDEFMSTARELVESGIQGQKILKAAKGGVVESDRYFRQPDDVYDARLRQFIREVVFGYWSQHHADMTLSKVFEGINQKIAEDIETGEWPKIWRYPSKRTIDRRTNECAFNDSRYWQDLKFPPLVCLKAGHYQPNPRMFDEATIDAIMEAGE